MRLDGPPEENVYMVLDSLHKAYSPKFKDSVGHS